MKKKQTKKELMDHLHQFTTSKEMLKAIFKEYPTISKFVILQDKQMVKRLKGLI